MTGPDLTALLKHDFLLIAILFSMLTVVFYTQIIVKAEPVVNEPNLKVELLVEGTKFPTSMRLLGSDDILMKISHFDLTEDRRQLALDRSVTDKISESREFGKIDNFCTGYFMRISRIILIFTVIGSAVTV